MTAATDVRREHRLSDSMVDLLRMLDRYQDGFHPGPSHGMSGHALERRGLAEYRGDRPGSMSFRLYLTDDGRHVLRRLQQEQYR